MRTIGDTATPPATALVDRAWPAEMILARAATWHRLGKFRVTARILGDPRVAAQAKADIELLSRTLVVVLGLHEPRPGESYCPGCSNGVWRAPWPCRTWLAACGQLAQDPA